MAFDGITVAAIRSETDSLLAGGHIGKIIQPEPDELVLTVKNNARTYRLLLSASPSLPLACLISSNRQAPVNAPAFCMLLRKHIGGGRLIKVTQPDSNISGTGLERILVFHIEHRDEMGDLHVLRLVAEFMGKHSNIILINEDDTIIDSIRRVSANVSSVREVLPGRKYFIPETQHKKDPLSISSGDFMTVMFSKNAPLYKAVYTGLTGFSPVMAEELCARAGLDPDCAADDLDDISRLNFFHAFEQLSDTVRENRFEPVMYFKNGAPFEYSAEPLSMYDGLESGKFSSISELIETYYSEKELRTRIRQRSSDLRKITSTALERCGRTLALQERQLHDTEKRDKYRIWGELLNTYGYSASKGDRELTAVNYYTNEPVKIPLDQNLTPSQNAQKYFDRYDKLKRTADALTVRIKDTEAEAAQLEGIMTSLEMATDEKDLDEIRQELSDFGFIHHHSSGGKRSKPSRPLHFISSDGFDIYVGKNNYQNEEVTFKIANGNDMWFHANDIPGSHVIVRAMGREIPDSTYEEAGRLAAYYSKGRGAPKVEIDYTKRANLHKPTGGRPGFVIYHTNYSMMAVPDISGISLADQ